MVQKHDKLVQVLETDKVKYDKIIQRIKQRQKRPRMVGEDAS